MCPGFGAFFQNHHCLNIQKWEGKKQLGEPLLAQSFPDKLQTTHRRIGLGHEPHVIAPQQTGGQVQGGGNGLGGGGGLGVGIREQNLTPINARMPQSAHPNVPKIVS